MWEAKLVLAVVLPKGKKVWGMYWKYLRCTRSSPHLPSPNSK